MSKQRSFYSNAAWFIGFAFILLFSTIGCSPERPPGWVHLGLMADLVAPMTFLQDKGILLRRDERGFYAMSTLCTSDLTELRMVQGSNGPILASSNSESTYDLDGHVLHGPATKDLPYYELSLNSTSYGGPKDALYVNLGAKQPADWRFSPE